MELPGERKQERPKRRWRDCVEDDMRKSGMSTEDALDRRKWNCQFAVVTPNEKMPKEEEENLVK